LNSATVEPQTATLPASLSRLPALLLFATLALLWFMLCRNLSLEWSANEQYSYGWFVPFFAAFLFWLRWEEWGKAENGQLKAETSDISVQRPETNASSSAFSFESPASPPAALRQLSAFAFALFLLLPVRLFEVANPDWRPLSWVHALAVVGLTLLAIWYWGGRTALKHFAFPVCFILIAVPWVTPIEGPIVQGLMRLVAAVATETLTLFGIPAQLEGSLIRVNNGVVGVNEACSGVRSLQTSLMIGLLFGELKRLTIARRLWLVAAALAIALVANFARAFFLVWIAATRDLAAVERWHDVAGYAIVGAVFLGTLAIAAALAKLEGRAPSRPRISPSAPLSRGRDSARPSNSTLDFRLPPLPFLLFTFAFLLFIEFAVEGWYRWHERNFVPSTSWSVRWPENAPGFRELPIAENIRSTLRYDSGREASWRFTSTTSPNEPAKSGNCTVFSFRWQPGSASILRARAHRPDICLPNTGWRLTSDAGVRGYRANEEVALPFRHFRFVRRVSGSREIFAEAFFCQREDRVPPGEPDRFDATAGSTGNWMRDDRVRVVREGLRNQGQQVLEVVLLTPNEMGNDAAEAEFARLMPNLVKVSGKGDQ
jgi:exosortase